MSTTGTLDYKQVLEAIRVWPAWQRFDLIKDVLSTLEPARPMASNRKEALERLFGMAKEYGPPPSDEDVARWLEERRIEKFG